jgi:3-hydroxyisobutyrate dehydrogenase-like beta-hydroxyacid dehydrogenase
MGDMGLSVGIALLNSGIEVLTNLDGRSKKTIKSAKSNNIKNITLSDLIDKSDIILSIIPPSASVEVANKLSKLSQLNSKSLTYVECNAISPDTTKFIEKSFITTAFKNSKYIDGSIIGTAPTDTYKPKLYISGKYANKIEFLKSKAFQIINLGDKLEAASSIKMCYASLTKGTSALWISLLLLSKKLNIFEELIEELDYSQKDTLIKMKNQIPKLPLKSGRWIAEMREIASTYVSQSLNSGSLDNSAYIYSLVSLIENKKIKDLSNLMNELNINSKESELN